MAILRANFGFYSAMAEGLAYDTTTTSWISTTAANNRLQIYSGTMPDDANDFSVSGSPLGYQDGSPQAELLAVFSNFRIDVNDLPSGGDGLNVQEVVFTTAGWPNPGTVNAVGTGTAAWWAMWQTQTIVTYGALLGEVSLSGGNGSVHLDSLSLTAGQPVQLLHWGVKFQA